MTVATPFFMRTQCDLAGMWTLMFLQAVKKGLLSLLRKTEPSRFEPRCLFSHPHQECSSDSKCFACGEESEMMMMMTLKEVRPTDVRGLASQA